jgi:nitrite reductase/ring-hydroxylating ferredoxin subunit
VLTDVVIGSFTSATLLDLVGGDESGRARQRLIAIGIAAYGPTALTGVNDWADTEPANDGARRVGLVHAATNTVALSLQIASLAARRRGARHEGVLLGMAGTAVLAAGGYLGGHLSFAEGVGPDQTVFDPGPSDWTPVGDAGELREAEPMRLVVDDTPVMVLRRGERVHAIHDRCSHRGCSLSDGDLDGDVVECNCHGSRFSLTDGSLLRGPATAPQPAFDVRERDGRIELRAARPRPLSGI